MSGKWLELLQETAPRLSTVAMMMNPNNSVARNLAKDAEAISPKRHLKVEIIEVREAQGFEGAFEQARRQALDSRPVNVNQLVVGMEELIRRTVGPAIAVETTTSESALTLAASCPIAGRIPRSRSRFAYGESARSEPVTSAPSARATIARPLMPAPARSTST